MLSLAARLRPKRLSEVVGQTLVRKILQNGLEQKKLSSACLFAGPAGTGKTTLARVTALWLVCSNKKEIDGKLQPCLECENCVELQNGSHPDVFEFDAASNTGVDDIQACLEGAYYKTQKADHKIYIIDEVHMLSNSAISSLLKIIEEPAENLWFFLATTELNKIPYTIISRCLTMQLESIPDDEMIAYLDKVCKEHECKYEDGVLELIAQAAMGGLRGALSYLEQGMLLGELTFANMLQIVKLLSHQQLQLIYDALPHKETLYNLIKEALKVANPYLLAMQLLQLAEKNGDFQLALQMGYVLEELAYSPCPDKILWALLCKAVYLNSLPSPQVLWSKVKESGEKLEETKNDDLLAKAKQLFK